MDIIGTIAIVVLVGLVIAGVVLLRKTSPKKTEKAPEAVRETELQTHKEEVRKETPAPKPIFERVVREEPVYDRMAAPRRQYGEPSAPDNTALLFGASAVAATTYDSGSPSSDSGSSSSSDSGSSSSFE